MLLCSQSRENGGGRKLQKGRRQPTLEKIFVFSPHISAVAKRQLRRGENSDFPPGSGKRIRHTPVSIIVLKEKEKKKLSRALVSFLKNKARANI